MIKVQRLNGEPLIVHATHIVLVESTPDTLLTLSTGEKLLVKDSAAQVVQKVTDFLRALTAGPILPQGTPALTQPAASQEP